MDLKDNSAFLKGPHPTLGESIGMAAEDFESHCTDLAPQKNK